MQSLLTWKSNTHYRFCVRAGVRECVALDIQDSKRMRRIVLSSVAYLAVPYFSTYIINDTILGKIHWS